MCYINANLLGFPFSSLFLYNFYILSSNMNQGPPAPQLPPGWYVRPL